MDKVYIVQYLGTPLGVYWSWRTARKMIAKLGEQEMMDLSKYTIHEVPLENFQVFIREAMQWAGEQDEDKPVVIPTTHDAFFWMVSEVGEAAQAYINDSAEWKRNHPGAHDDDSYGWEIGQVILMAFLASTDSPFDVVCQQLEKWGWQDATPEDIGDDPYGKLYDVLTAKE